MIERASRLHNTVVATRRKIKRANVSLPYCVERVQRTLNQPALRTATTYTGE